MRSKKITLVVVPLLLSACGHHNDKIVQDVYKNQYDCSYDWDDTVCEPEQHSTSSAHGTYVSDHYLGPAYYQDNREVSLRDYTLHPSTDRSIQHPIVSTTALHSSISSPIRGGFGRGGFSFGG